MLEGRLAWFQLLPELDLAKPDETIYAPFLVAVTSSYTI